MAFKKALKINMNVQIRLLTILNIDDIICLKVRKMRCIDEDRLCESELERTE